MALVHLIVTGTMEEKALARSLKGCFPDHEFSPKPRLDGFTSAWLPPDFARLSAMQRLLLNIDKFAKQMIGAVAPGGRSDRQAPDFVVGVEDLELLNADAPENVTRAVREAIERNLEAWPGRGAAAARLRATVQARCSFHLMAPMTEAYFFAEPEAFARATRPGPDHPNRFDAGAIDAEEFRVEDAAFQAPSDLPKKDDHRWRRAERHRHPKAYLAYLTDPRLDNRPRYDETTLGCDALGGLAWGSMLKRRPTAVRYARSLLADLAEMLDCEPVGCGLGDLENRACHPLTWPPPRESVLRNL